MARAVPDDPWCGLAEPDQLATVGGVGSDDEKERLLAYVGKMQAYHANTPAPDAKYPTRITRSLVEEFSGLQLGAYGGAVDGEGNLWFAPMGGIDPINPLARVDIDDFTTWLD